MTFLSVTIFVFSEPFVYPGGRFREIGIGKVVIFESETGAYDWFLRFPFRLSRALLRLFPVFPLTFPVFPLCFPHCFVRPCGRAVPRLLLVLPPYVSRGSPSISPCLSMALCAPRGRALPTVRFPLPHPLPRQFQDKSFLRLVALGSR